MKWTAPPDRREITLVLFSLTVFILSYNLDISLRLLGLDPSTQRAIFNTLGLGELTVIEKDGRKPLAWRDSLENTISGDWRWDEKHVAGSGAERSQEKGIGRYGAQWLGRSETGEVSGEVFGEKSVNDGIVHWDMIPRSTVLQHTPGYTIVDSPILFNGSVYIVTDDFVSIPPIESIMSPQEGSNERDWKVISGREATKLFGSYGGKITGVTFLSNDISPSHNSTLIALWRTYSSLDPFIDAAGRTTLSSPRRIVFARMPVFLDPRVPPIPIDLVRVPSQIGFHPFLAKAAFPTLTTMYEHDWADYHLMGVPFILERVVIADRVAAEMGATKENSNPFFAAPFVRLPESRHWLEPIRRSLVLFLDMVEERMKKTKPVVTYLQTQEQSQGPRLRDGDHRALVDALKKMGRDYGYEVHVVSDSVTRWHERMNAIARSTIVLGVHGYTLLDSIFMKPSEQSTLMEIFPSGIFTRDREVFARALGMRYVAWWNDQQFSDSSLPSVVEPTSTSSQEVSVDAQAVVRAIQARLTR